jgi:2-methylcitrate dehydratase PrpD
MAETQALVRFIVDTSYGDLPGEVVEQAKVRVLDYLGAALYGSTKEWSKVVGDFVTIPYCQGESTVIASKGKTAAPYAALANGTMGHGFELDDFHARALVHPGTVVIPAALALGEKENESGRGFLAATVLGYEIMIRMGLAVEPSNSLRGFHPTGCNGTFGSAAAAGKVLKLDQGELLNALGIAGSLSSGIKEFYLEGGMVKRLHAGRAAEGGLMAALLANRGFTGPSTVIEGKYGYCNAFSDDSNLSALTENLKEEWHLMDASIKPYACCGNLHSMVGGLMDLTREYGIRPKDIESIVVGTSERVALQNAGPGTKSVMAAQYSIPFMAALTLLEDIEDPAVFTESALKDKELLTLSRRVRVVGNLAKGEIERSRVTVKLTGGKEHTIEIEKPKGHPENPLSYDEVIGKFRKLSSCVLPDQRIDKIIESVGRLEEMKDITVLCDLVRL